jgi:hypothetical protein
MDNRGVVAQARNDGFSAVMYLVTVVLDLLGETLRLPNVGTGRLGSRRSL